MQYAWELIKSHLLKRGENVSDWNKVLPNSDTAELIIQSDINDYPAAAADINQMM